ncbi:glycosyltransferase family 4 protein [Thiomicrospira microaerophila]|uniref:glycosyltransferase family 4 protein n=1 Tax=Thiomicrospira microaerophila TaxID=406020 RepID=UPI00200D0F4C|nr:glycosyltransferase family 4 protein [Thiomicrospira microaerophila]UQB43362.1 glycosyltransferase family 4 protein [Thiomicrospira microaerophila]
MSPPQVKLIPLAIERDISLLSDLKSLFALRKTFSREKFDLVLSVTPKAGLLSALAGCFSGTRNRLHWFTGQVWLTQRGFKRYLLKSIDKLLASCVRFALVDSQSQFDFLIAEKVLNPSKGEVLGEGSICGVNLERFKFNEEARAAFRAQIGLSDEAKVLLFLGRLNKDKGIFDLVEAFNLIVNEIDNLHLVLVGPDEQLIEQSLSSSEKLHPKIHFIGGTSEPEKWLSVGDVFCLPSYREGFGSSVIEAAAVGLPAITSRIYGLTDAVVEGQTGLMHQVGNVDEIASKMKQLINDEELTKRLGENARQRAESSFSQRYVSGLLLDYMNKELSSS